jgi:FSR family fosmidomycin resistance protein-like MFS transporter
VAVVAAQQIFPDNRATASSLALGFGLGLGGLGVGLISIVADKFGLGIEQTLFYVSFLPIVAAAFALGLPGKRV